MLSALLYNRSLQRTHGVIMSQVKSLFEICTLRIHHEGLIYCVLDLKYLNLPPVIVDYFIEIEYNSLIEWMKNGDEPTFYLPVSTLCECVPFPYSLNHYKTLIYSSEKEPCHKHLPRLLPPLRFTRAPKV